VVVAIGALFMLLFGGVVAVVRHLESFELSPDLTIIVPLAFQLVVHLNCYHSTYSCFDFAI
jgi:hypothetical protein